ncbi:hypothetical protein ACLBOM_37490 [Escherichia coli]
MSEKAGNFFVVGGSLKDNHPIVLAEGYATAAAARWHCVTLL